MWGLVLPLACRPGGSFQCVHASLGDVSAGSKLSTRLGSQACSSLEAFVCLQVNVATFPTRSSSRVIGVPVLQGPSEND